VSDVVDIAASEIIGHEDDNVRTVEGAGDLDADGLADFVAGGDASIVYLFYGPGPAGIVEAELTADAFLLGTGGEFGSAMDAIGDHNGDCYPDLLIGDWRHDETGTNDEGGAWLVLGGYL
jgi:hypothetical protein